MQPAFAALSKEPRIFFAHAVLQLACRVRVSHTYISLFPQRVIREIVYLEIHMDVAVGPIYDRVELHSAMLKFKDLAIRAVVCLNTA